MNFQRMTPRGLVLGVLSTITLGVVLLSILVTWRILQPHFGAAAAPTVGALDALWGIFQAAEVLAANNRPRARRVRRAGLALTAVTAAIPTAELVMTTAGGGFDLAVVLCPVAIVATKAAWWLTLPSLGRRVSPETRAAIAQQRQSVADRLEQMEAETAGRTEFLRVATALEEQVAEAETAYRAAVLELRQRAADGLHEQSQLTETTLAEKPVAAVADEIPLPQLGTWAPGTVQVIGRHAGGTPALPGGTQVEAVAAHGVDDGGTRAAHLSVTVDDAELAELAAKVGVETPTRGAQLTDAQMALVLRYLRYAESPPTGYRSARDTYRAAGFTGSEDRLREQWRAVKGQGLDEDEQDERETA